MMSKQFILAGVGHVRDTPCRQQSNARGIRLRNPRSDEANLPILVTRSGSLSSRYCLGQPVAAAP